MKILVIEDKQMHQDSARETLKGHDVTIVGSYDQAIKALNRRDAKYNLLPLEYEVVLTDMNMPMCKQALTNDVFNPVEQVPYGFVLALMSAHRGAKYVAMVTDTNHHKGAMSAALDELSPSYYAWHHDSKYVSDNPTVFNINGAKVVFVHTPFVEDVYPNSDCIGKGEPCDGLCDICHGTMVYSVRPCWQCADRKQEELRGKCLTCEGTLKYTKKVHERKDWGQVLKDLTGEE